MSDLIVPLLIVDADPSGAGVNGAALQWNQTNGTLWGVVTGVWTQIGGSGSGLGTVTSVGLVGTANQLTVTGSSPITTAGLFTISIPSALIVPGSIQTSGNLTLQTQSANSFAYGYISQKRGKTGDATAAPVSGSELGGLYLQGWNGTTYSATAAGIVGVTTENWSDTNNGAHLQFYTTPNGTTPNQYSAVLTDAGNLNLLSSGVLGFSSSSSTPETPDTGIARNAAGVLEINNGTKGTLRDVSVRNILTTLTTPASSSAAGVAGTIVADGDYVYVCTATNTWKRTALTSF